MNKFILILLILLFSFNLSSQDSVEAPLFKSSDCLSHIENHLEKMSESDEYSFSGGESEIIDNCFYDYMVYNTSNHIMYFIFGEPYLDSLRVSIIPYQFFTNMLFTYSDKNINLSLDVDSDFKNDFLKKNIIFGSVVQSIMKIIVGITSVVMVILIVYYYSKKIIKTQRGVFDKENVKDGLKMITGATLLSPLPFFGGYSLVMVVLFVSIGFGLMLVNTFFIFVYSMLFVSEVSSIRDSAELNYDKHNIENFTSIKNTLNQKIIGNMCLIDYAEKYISSNISDTSIIGSNKATPISERVNFFNCLGSFNYMVDSIESPLISSSNRIYFRESAFNYCVKNHAYFYNGDLRQEMVGVKSNCFIDSGDLSGATNYVRRSQTYLDSSAFSYASKLYKKDCENSHFRQTVGNQEFKCIDFDEFAKYNFDEPTQLFEIIEPVDYGVEFANEIKEINETKDDNLSGYAIYVYDLAGQSASIDSIFESSVMGKFISFNIGSLISNGWLYSSSIFVPKKIYTDISRLIDTIDFENEISEHVLNINRTVNFDVQSNENYSNYVFSDSVNGLVVSDEGDESLNFISKNFNTKNASDCIVNREGCNILMAPSFLNPIEVAQRIFENGLWGVDQFSTSEFSFAMAIASSSYIAFLNTKKTGNRKADSVIEFKLINLKRMFVVFAIMSAISLLIIILLPLIPFLVFASAILSWIYKLFQAPILIQLFTLSYFTPEENNEDFIDERGSESKIYQLLGEMSLTPLFLVIGVFVSYVIMIISLILLNILLFIAMATLMPEPTNMMGNLLFMVIYYLIYAVIALLVVLSASKTVLTTVQEINRFLGFNSFSGSNTFDSIISTLQSKLLV